MEFAKGHGTQNDFVLIPDPDGQLRLDAENVSALCDRRRGLGADGILRIARTGTLVAAGVLPSGELPGVDDEDWFMDYRNADGSVAEMCGNGVRVFAHYLRVSGMETRDEFVVGSRAGARNVVVHAGTDETRGDVTVDMGPVKSLGDSAALLAGRRFAGVGIDVGNPHLACVVPDLDAPGLAALDFRAPPEFDPEIFPQGVNIEILTPLHDGSVHMRVHERGVGETRSCGTGTVAAAAAALRASGQDEGKVRVVVPGGEVWVSLESGTAYLRGPSVLVAHGRIDDVWWQSPV